MRRRNSVGVTVTGGFVLTAALLLYWDTQGLLPWVVLTFALHEGGHWLAATLAGRRVWGLRLSAVGAELQIAGRCPMTYPQELMVAGAGPAFNLLVAALLARAPLEGEPVRLLVGLNLAAGCFNLLPIWPLDGGRILESAVALLWSPGAAEAVRCWAGGGLIGAALVLGGAAVWQSGGRSFTLLLTALWLLTGWGGTKSR